MTRENLQCIPRELPDDVKEAAPAGTASEMVDEPDVVEVYGYLWNTLKVHLKCISRGTR